MRKVPGLVESISILPPGVVAGLVVGGVVLGGLPRVVLGGSGCREGGMEQRRRIRQGAGLHKIIFFRYLIFIFLKFSVKVCKFF